MTVVDFNLSDPISTDTLDSSTNLDSLYCSHLWKNSNLRNAIINAPFRENEVIKYCYTCKGKIRKYQIKPPINSFIPNNHSTPNGKIIAETIIESPVNRPNNEHYEVVCSDTSISESLKNLNTTNEDVKRCIPSISHHVDTSFRHKFTSYDTRPKNNRRRLRKSLKGIGCAINFKLTDSPVKKRTQIRACSIIVMIIAIVVISFILVNFTTPTFTRAINTTAVPTEYLENNDTTYNIGYTDIPLITEYNITTFITTTEYSDDIVNSDENNSISAILSKIRKNIKTYSKDSSKNKFNAKPKEIINRDLSQRFCSCQKNQICMLDESSGTSVCRHAADEDDPTGCGGLCALETEACHLVDKELGVRACRLLNLVRCSTQEWRCRNGLCVPASARCDGSIQCYDRSDEVQCDCDLIKEFRCGHSLSCFSYTKRCDGTVDCWDGSDEFNCTTECSEDQFACTNGQCILSSRFCDGLADCTDRSDEPLGCDGACGAHETRCKNKRCVPHAVLCDGNDNCGDGSDELNCSV